MANVVLSIGTPSSAQASLEKYVDLDMDSVYKAFPQKADVDTAAFTKEQAADESGRIFKEQSASSAVAVDKKFKKSIDVDYSGYKIAKSINVNAVKQSVHNIFSWMLGERILNPEFGTNLR